MITLTNSTEVFDFTNLSEAQLLQNRILEIINQSAILSLDWKFIFSIPESVDDFYKTFNLLTGRVNDDLQPYFLPMNLIDFHFLFSVITGSPDRYPFNSVSCNHAVYDRPVISIKGFFSGSIVNIPTAIDVELRPLGLYGHLPGSITNLEDN